MIETARPDSRCKQREAAARKIWKWVGRAFLTLSMLLVVFCVFAVHRIYDGLDARTNQQRADNAAIMRPENYKPAAIYLARLMQSDPTFWDSDKQNYPGCDWLPSEPGYVHLWEPALPVSPLTGVGVEAVTIRWDAPGTMSMLIRRRQPNHVQLMFFTMDMRPQQWTEASPHIPANIILRLARQIPLAKKSSSGAASPNLLAAKRLTRWAPKLTYMATTPRWSAKAFWPSIPQSRRRFARRLQRWLMVLDGQSEFTVAAAATRRLMAPLSGGDKV